MKPVLIDFGFFRIYSYGLFVSLGILVAFFFSLRKAKEYGIEEDRFYTMGMLAILFGLAFSRISFVLANLEYYLDNPSRIFHVWEGGLTSYGAIFGGILAILVYAKMKKIDFLLLADAIAYGAPLGFAIGRIGCLLNGCCYGVVADTPISIVFPSLGDGKPRIPTQIIESLYSLFTFFAVRYADRRFALRGANLFTFAGLYGLFRFFNEFLRVNPKAFLGLSGSQVSSILLVISSVVFFASNYDKLKKRSTHGKRG